MTSEVTIELKLSFQTNTNERTYDNESAKSGRIDTPTSFSVHRLFFRIFVDWFTKFEVVINLFILRVLSQTITTKTHTHTCIHTYTHT